MSATELSISGTYVVESMVRADDRGFFREWFSLADLLSAGLSFHPEQANFSVSKQNVVRGLHYSLAPRGQSKLVTCVLGEFDDVIVDIRVGSPTFGAVEIVSLAADLGRSVLLPVGVAHGFCVTSESAAICYLLSSPFNAPMELEIDPFDKEINVAWKLSGGPVLSEKDAHAPSLQERQAAGELPRFG